MDYTEYCIIHTVNKKLRAAFKRFIDVDQQSIADRLYWLFLIAFLFCVAVFVINLFSIGQSSFGEWGDFFGGVLNPLLTFIMFMALLFTIILQQKELSEAREQFTRSADALNAQVMTSHLSAFENTFFSMVNALSNTVQQIDLVERRSGRRTEGRDCFGVFYSRLRLSYQDEKKEQDNRVALKELIDLTFKKFFEANEMNIGPYFKMIETIMIFLEEAPRESQVYMNFLRSQLSRTEIILIFYYYVTSQSENFRRLVEDRRLLVDLNTDWLIEEQHLQLVNLDELGATKR